MQMDDREDGRPHVGCDSIVTKTIGVIR